MLLREKLINITKFKNGAVHGSKLRHSFLSKHFTEEDFEEIYKSLNFDVLDQLDFSKKIILFLKNITRQEYCKTCNNPLIPTTKGFKEFCSSKCAVKEAIIKEKISKASTDWWNSVTEQDLIDRRDKRINTNKKKYGYEISHWEIKENHEKVMESNSLKRSEINKKISNANRNNITSKNKREGTLFKKYGVGHNSYIPIVVEKRKDTFSKHTNDEKQKIIVKTKATKLEKYGSENYVNKEKMIDTRKKNRLEPFKETLCDTKWVEENRNTINKGIHILADKLNVDSKKTLKIVRELNINVPNNKSYLEDLLLLEFDKHNISGFKQNDRKTIGLELDFYFPEQKLAIELNGLKWHSELYKENNYHKMKLDKCNEKGITLLQFYTFEIKEKMDIVLSMIRAKLGIIPNKIHGRKCIVQEINSKEAKIFSNENHIKGFVGANKHLGLYYEDKLVSYMSFSKPRFNKDYEWEMIRFCSSKDTIIYGAASKFIKFFDKKSIITYADLRYSTGNVYEKCGFEYIKTSSPNYYYTKDFVKLESRNKFQKHKLSSLLESFNPAKSEHENMLENGYYRIYDCGNKVYKLLA